jgi:hypothetical protein
MKKLVNYRPKVSELPTEICSKAPSLLEFAKEGGYKDLINPAIYF